jgi:uncharacterized protein YcfJ
MIASTASPYRLLKVLAWITGVAVILFGMVVVAGLMGWIPDSIRGAGAKPVSEAAKTPTKLPRDKGPVAFCARCGVIVSMRDIVNGGESSGAVVAGLIGLQLGGGRGRDIALLAGAVGGGTPGKEIEKKVKTTQAREITVLLDDGSHTVIRLADAAAWHTGDHVKIIAGVMHRN